MSNYTTQENSYISSVDAKSLIINQLTREIESLKRNCQETSHLLEKISNLEYMCQLLTTEKERSQQDFDFKNDKKSPVKNEIKYHIAQCIIVPSQNDYSKCFCCKIQNINEFNLSQKI